MTEVRLFEPHLSADIGAARALFEEYASTLPFDLDYQNFDAEISGFPGEYARPRGCLILAHVDGAAAGAVGLRPIQNDIAEVKRLYVRPAFRGLKLGYRLVEAVVRAGKEIGYAALRLDTIRGLMANAETLYRDAGFIEIAPYYDNPIEGAVYYELRW